MEPHVICHLDLDCFYAQVEAKRLRIPPDVPVAVQQWNSIIAVNYPARKLNVKRFVDSPSEALAKCPNLQLVHTETIGLHSLDTSNTSANITFAHTKNNSMVSLERYRRESALVFRVVLSMFPSIEKGSIDECYIDMTSCVSLYIKENKLDMDFSLFRQWLLNDNNINLIGNLMDFNGEIRKTVDIFEQDLSSILQYIDINDYNDRYIIVGAVLAAKLRLKIKEETEFTISAGISCGKIFSKLASALKKPDSQTIILRSVYPILLRTVPLRKFMLLGAHSKLGDTVEKLSRRATEFENETCPTLASLQQYSLETLQLEIGDRSSWLYDLCRGIDNSQISVGFRPKSLLSAKSMNAKSVAEVEKWALLISHTLVTRLKFFGEEFGWPISLVFHVSFTSSKNYNRQIPFPLPVLQSLRRDLSAEEIFSISMNIRTLGLKLMTDSFDKTSVSYIPLKFLGFSLTSFVLESENNLESSNMDISRYFKRQKNISETIPNSELDIRCEKCGIFIDVNLIDDHSDMHIAQEIHEKEREAQRQEILKCKSQNRNMTGELRKSSKQLSTKKSMTTPSHKINFFFNPKSDMK